MKTTVNLNRDLVAEAIETAVRERTSLSQLIEEGLRLRLAPGRRGSIQSASARLAIYQGRGGLQANVNPLSNRSLLGSAEA
jgi:hypothetical protein